MYQYNRKDETEKRLQPENLGVIEEEGDKVVEICAETPSSPTTAGPCQVEFPLLH